MPSNLKLFVSYKRGKLSNLINPIVFVTKSFFNETGCVFFEHFCVKIEKFGDPKIYVHQRISILLFS